jgi:hypothetical protein
VTTDDHSEGIHLKQNNNLKIKNDNKLSSLPKQRKLQKKHHNKSIIKALCYAGPNYL